MGDLVATGALDNYLGGVGHKMAVDYGSSDDEDEGVGEGEEEDEGAGGGAASGGAAGGAASSGSASSGAAGGAASSSAALSGAVSSGAASSGAAASGAAASGAAYTKRRMEPSRVREAVSWELAPHLLGGNAMAEKARSDAKDYPKRVKLVGLDERSDPHGKMRVGLLSEDEQKHRTLRMVLEQKQAPNP